MSAAAMPGPAATGSLAGRARRLTLELLKAAHESGNRGPDAYTEERVPHAMADGKMLAALAVCRAEGWLSPLMDQLWTTAALERLDASRLVRGRTSGWGLGFATRGYPPDEPFAITTSLVAAGLDVTPGPLAKELLAGAARWLCGCCDPATGLPLFASVVPRPVVNVVAYWADAMRRTGKPDRAAIGYEWVRQRSIPGVGWGYEPGNDRIDLLHQGYIVEPLRLAALAGSPGAPTLEVVERAARCVLATFDGPEHLLDKVDLMDESEAVSACERSRRLVLRPTGADDRWLVIHPKRARPWSYGETLVMAAGLAATGPNAVLWQRRLASMTTEVLDQWEQVTAPWDGNVFPRDAMHLAHGLASAAANLGNSVAAASASAAT